MAETNFESCKSDPELWYRPGTKDDDTKYNHYNQYFLLYTDDMSCIMEKSRDFMENEVGSRFKLKQNSIGPLTQYLGNKVTQVIIEDGKNAGASAHPNIYRIL